ncbi:sulfatase-like hydrolase/transferase [Pseudoduganella sp. GCM10020061]|uniref:sulfatase-like hydrolase/transferase n=1 Tax=Pseudoduganella sp. GCM10020061 TaxID=3317345 RepID=UPI003637055D
MSKTKPSPVRRGRGTAQPARHANTASLLIAILSMLVTMALVAAGSIDLSPYLGEPAATVRDIAMWRSGEYLFFIGTTYLSLLLLRQNRWLLAPLVFGAGVAWASYHGSIMDFVGNLGGDSLSEAQHFDLAEARFWLETLGATITSGFDWEVMGYYMAAGVASYLALRYLLRQLPITARLYSHLKLALAVVLIGTALYQSLSNAVKLFMENTQAYSGTMKNFQHAAPVLVPGDKGVDLLVYVGESTAAMNMGIYGYPRDTTPKLQKLRDTDSNLLVFHNVFSTHSHTSPSLLEALSFGIDRNEYYLPIEKRKRLSIVDLLVKNRIATTLTSSQGQTGTWNMASSIIFQRARSTYSSNTRAIGNNDWKLTKPWDHEFFQQKMDTVFAGPDSRTQVAFLHSYAGHGGYFENIPPAFHKYLDDGFGAGPVKDAPGSVHDGVEKYDAAIRYIDHSVSQSIEYVRKQSRPIVFVYFADHGESAYTGRAHDSSQFIHEMARIPFMVYFNDAARARMPAAYRKYRALAAAGRDATLEQLPSTLLDLADIRIRPDQRGKLIEMPVIGEHVRHPPIVVRETATGVTYVNINPAGAAAPAAAHAVDHSDDATRLYTASKNKANGASRVCVPGVDTIDKLVRSRMVASCIEITVAANGDGKLTITSADGKDTGVRLKDVLKVIGMNRMGLWIRAPELRSGASCDTLATQLEQEGKPGKSILVDFPAGSHANAPELKACSARLVGMGVATLYRVDDTDALPCARAVAADRKSADAPVCAGLREDLEAASRSKLFTDIGFDHEAAPAIGALTAARSFRWNTWNVAPAGYSAAMSERYAMTILGVVERPAQTAVGASE